MAGLQYVSLPCVLDEADGMPSFPAHSLSLHHAGGHTVLLQAAMWCWSSHTACPRWAWQSYLLRFVQLDAAALEPPQKAAAHQHALRRRATSANCHEESCCCLMALIAPLPEQMSHCRSSTMESPLRVPSNWRIPLRMLAPSSSRRSVGLLGMCHRSLDFCIPKKLCFIQTSHAHVGKTAAVCLISSLQGHMLLSKRTYP